MQFFDGMRLSTTACNISISKKGEDREGKGREDGRRKDGQKGRRKKETLT